MKVKDVKSPEFEGKVKYSKVKSVCIILTLILGITLASGKGMLAYAQEAAPAPVAEEVEVQNDVSEVVVPTEKAEPGATDSGPADSADAKPTSPPWWTWIINFDGTWSALEKGFLWLLGLLFGFNILKDVAYQSLVEDLKAGATEVWKSSTAETRAMLADGKIEKSEIERLRDESLKAAKAHMWPHAKALAKVLGEKYLGALTERVVSWVFKRESPAAPSE